MSKLHLSTFIGSKTTSNKLFNEKITKGICFWCDDKYVSGHKCPKKQTYLLQLKDEQGKRIVVKLKSKRFLWKTMDWDAIVSTNSLGFSRFKDHVFDWDARKETIVHLDWLIEHL